MVAGWMEETDPSRLFVERAHHNNQWFRRINHQMPLRIDPPIGPGRLSLEPKPEVLGACRQARC